MARRSNKTAHVLNLLAGHDSQNPTEETANNEAVPSSLEAAPEKETGQPVTKEDEKSDMPQPAKTDTEPAAISPPVSAQNISVIDTTGTDPVAELIQQELTNQFESELTSISPDDAADSMADVQDNEQQAAETMKAADVDTPESPAIDSETAEITETVTADSTPVTQVTQLTAETPETVPEPKPEEPEVTTDSDTNADEEPEVTTDSDTNADVEPEPDFVYLNVMEEIVKDKIIYFMRQFNICTCDRCKADTIALTMNGLMPKYIVTAPAAVAPLVSYYTNRLIPDVTVEAIKACMTVKDNPRH